MQQLFWQGGNRIENRRHGQATFKALQRLSAIAPSNVPG
jgi:hypothetical protein